MHVYSVVAGHEVLTWNDVVDDVAVVGYVVDAVVDCVVDAVVGYVVCCVDDVALWLCCVDAVLMLLLVMSFVVF